MSGHDPRRRVPVQADNTSPGKRAGTVEWHEHECAWRDYARRYGTSQSAERIAERGGFGYGELVVHLGHAPLTWEAR